MSKRASLFGIRPIVWLVLAMSQGSLSAQEMADTFKPLWSRSLLCDGPDCRTVRPTRTTNASDIPVSEEPGAGVLRVTGRRVEHLDAAGAVLWRHDASERGELRFLAIVEGTIFLAVENAGFFTRGSPGGTLRRLRLTDGAKLDSLKIPTDADEDRSTGEILASLVHGDGLIVLSESTVSSKMGRRSLSYRVSRFQDELTWSRSFKTNVAFPLRLGDMDGLFRSADERGIQPLTKMGEILVVCAGPLEDVLALNSVTGEVKWQIPRLWEYQKGYGGPSIHSHFINRYGLYRFAEDKAPSERDVPFLEARKKEAETRRCAIVAGPVAIPVVGEPQRYSLFIATSQADDRMRADSMSRCVVYELDERGRCVGMVTLPHQVDGRRFVVLDESLVWRAGRLDWGRLYVSSPERRGLGGGGGPGNPNNTIDFEWHPHRRGRAPVSKAAEEAWFRQAVFSAGSMFHERMMLSISEGGYIKEENSQVFLFPLTLTDLESGRSRALLVKVPFEGRVDLRGENHSKAAGKWVIRSLSPIAIHSVDLRGNELQVTFESLFSRGPLTFDVTGLLKPEG